MPINDVERVFNCGAVLEQGLRRLREDDFPLSLGLIRAMSSLRLRASAVEVTGQQRHRVFAYQQYFDILGEGAQPLWPIPTRKPPRPSSPSVMGIAASELSTSQSLLVDLCELLAHPTAEQGYMFDRPLTFRHADSSVGRIDPYQPGAFVLESKKPSAGAHPRLRRSHAARAFAGNACRRCWICWWRWAARSSVVMAPTGPGGNVGTRGRRRIPADNTTTWEKSMGRKKGIPGLSFSWKRALGVSSAKARLSRQIAIPLTRAGRQQKLGRAMGCCVPAAFLVAGGLGALAASVRLLQTWMA